MKNGKTIKQTKKLNIYEIQYIVFIKNEESEFSLFLILNIDNEQDFTDKKQKTINKKNIAII